MVTPVSIEVVESTDPRRILTLPQEPVYLQVTAYNGIAITKIEFQFVKQVFQRALNTWPDAPQDLFKFCDALDQL